MFRPMRRLCLRSGHGWCAQDVAASARMPGRTGGSTGREVGDDGSRSSLRHTKRPEIAGDRPPPQRLLMDFGTGAQAWERNPLRYRVDGMLDAEHEKLVAAFNQRSRR